MIALEPVAELDVSAASGLAVTADTVFVVADDETFLAAYDFAGRPRGRIRLLGGALPEDHRARKRRKPDLEALAGLPDGRLLALGSGSRPQRMRGALFDPARGKVRSIDLSPLYQELAARVPELNVEGAAVLGDRLVLLQRGNSRAGVNACIELDGRTALAELDRRAALTARALVGVTRIELGALHGVPLGFTDAAPHPRGGLLFTAAAEDTRDPYEDAPCVGSVIGLLRGGAVAGAEAVRPVCKLEGIAVQRAGFAPTLWLVADPDDRAVRATLFRAPLPV